MLDIDFVTSLGLPNGHSSTDKEGDDIYTYLGNLSIDRGSVNGLASQSTFKKRQHELLVTCKT